MADFDYRELDTMIHARMRLGIMALLSSVDEAEFTFIRDRLKGTDGNLSVHMRKLEEVNYVKATKTFVAKRPSTTYRLSQKGRKALAAYLKNIEHLLKNPPSQAPEHALKPSS